MTLSRMVGRFLFLLVLHLACITYVSGRFYFKDFRDVRFLTLVGSAISHKQSDPPCVALTGGSTVEQNGNNVPGNQTGGMWYDRSIDMREKKRRRKGQGPDGFITSFHFRITPSHSPVNLTSAYEMKQHHLAEGLPLPEDPIEKDLPPGGDGFAFLFRSAPTTSGSSKLNSPSSGTDSASGSNSHLLGRDGSGLGYAGLNGIGIAVEFDTRMDLSERDPNANHVSVHIQTPPTTPTEDGAGGFSSYESNDARVVPLSFSTLSLRRPRVISSRKKRILVSSKPLVVQISYAPSKKQLKVWVEDVVSPLLVLNDVPPFTGTFQVGFTAATSGVSTDTHEICQWYFERQEVQVQGTETKATSNSGSIHPSAVTQQQKHVIQEPCDTGFTGESCMLDLKDLASECLFLTSQGCTGCLSHPSGQCQWCLAQQRCISNELTTRSFDQIQHKPYCSDPTSIIEEKEECSAVEEPKYILWGTMVVLFIIIIFTLIGLTGSLWLKSRTNQTLGSDIATLIFYTLLGSIFSIFMTSVVNMVLTEITSTVDFSASWSLGVFFILSTALIARDIHLFRNRGGSSSSGGRSGGGLNSPSLSYKQIQDPDDLSASEAIMNSFERQQQQQTAASGSGDGSSRHWDLGAPSSPLSSRTSSDRLVGIGSSNARSGNGSSSGSSYLGSLAQKFFHSLTTHKNMMFVPYVFIILSGLSILICFLILEKDWSISYGMTFKVIFYTILATSLLFTLAYLFITLWRLVKIFSLVLVDLCISGWKGRARNSSGINGGKRSSSSSAPDLCELLSQFASNTPLIRAVAQIRIMAISAMISGIYFGHMFGGLDKEDTTKSHLDLFVQRENYYSYPLAAFLGAMSSFTNQYLDLWRVSYSEAIFIENDGQDDL